MLHGVVNPYTLGRFMQHSKKQDTTLSNERDRCTQLPHLAEEYRKEMQQKIDEADAAARDAHEVTLRVSRQTYRDLVEAYRFLRQINPLYKSIGQRLEKVALQVRDGLDRKGVD